MTITRTVISYWKPSMTDGDAQHLQALGLRGATLKGNPYTGHLKRPGELKALCGKQPGAAGRTNRMVSRNGWYLWPDFEGPGRTPCEACLKAAELLSAPA
ncbi:MAG: hypothetical protein GAK28_04406 [Luteibacter sp.]|uniref:hypothetical protein n=1 Tax=Luteibacter sp. TaxID=1886636 RepID=UPI001380F2D9|nr:hypothetical protein [Luteibacter sp.]KAF1003943.1 MAG: hypothetical protein GAK28_04406 [Luteibacter sp.]